MRTALLAGALLGGPVVAHSADMEHGSVQNLDEMNLVPAASMPPCASSCLRSGDPAAGPSIILAKLATMHGPVAHARRRE
jgi:hypothetical protein